MNQFKANAMLHLLIGKTFAEFDVQIFQMQMIHFQKSFHANLIFCIMEYGCSFVCLIASVFNYKQLMIYFWLVNKLSLQKRYTNSNIICLKYFFIRIFSSMAFNLHPNISKTKWNVCVSTHLLLGKRNKVQCLISEKKLIKT